MLYHLSYSRFVCQIRSGLWAGKDSNLRTRTGPDLQSGAFNHSATCPRLSRVTGVWDGRAGGGTRTPNLLITSELLYQLSYASSLETCDTSKHVKVLIGFYACQLRVFMIQ